MEQQKPELEPPWNEPWSDCELKHEKNHAMWMSVDTARLVKLNTEP